MALPCYIFYSVPFTFCLILYEFICGIFSNSNSDYVALNDRIISEYLIGKNME
jgi:hypothetical protein